MHPSFSFLLSITLFIFFPQCTDSQQGDEYYRACAPKWFECGNFGDNISYPFQADVWRPDYCSHPGYKITCINDSPEIQIGSKTYRVAGRIDYGNQLLTVVEKQFADNGYCPIPISQDDYLPRPPLFRLVNSGFNVTLFSNCSEAIDNNPALKEVPNCLQNVEGNWAYYTTTTATPSSLLATVNDKCRVSLLPVLSRSYSWLTSNQITLVEAVKEGFQVYWLAGEDWCHRCRAAGGLCGRDPSDPPKSSCFCPDDRSQYPDCLRAPSPSDLKCRCPGTKARNTVKNIGLLAAAGIGGILLFVAVFVYMFKIKGQIFCSSNGISWYPSQERLLFWRNAPSTVSRHVEAFLENYGSSSLKRYKYSDLKKITDSLKEKLGQGGYGGVYKGKLIDGTSVAVKLLSETKGNNGEEFMNEVATIGRTSHVNVVTLLGFCSERTKRALVYEFLSNGSLEKYIYTSTSKDQDSKSQMASVPQLGWEKLYQIAVGIARGLEYLHRGCATRILHLDIKPHNILLDRDLCPKISDFGMAKLCPTRDSIVSMLGTRGTVGYIAPEVFCRNFGGVSYKSDVYSYGMMVIEMVGGRRNMINVEVDNTSNEIYFTDWIYNLALDHQNIISLGLLPDQKIATGEEQVKVRKMILVGIWCIQTNPANRPSMNQVLEMLEGSLEAIQVPPKPYLSSPPRSPDGQDSSAISSQQLGAEEY